jgi:hypothetical protein
MQPEAKAPARRIFEPVIGFLRARECTQKAGVCASLDSKAFRASCGGLNSEADRARFEMRLRFWSQMRLRFLDR